MFLDKNECRPGAAGDKCAASTGSVCNNVPGSFYCSCKEGYQQKNPGDSSQCSGIGSSTL